MAAGSSRLGSSGLVGAARLAAAGPARGRREGTGPAPELPGRAAQAHYVHVALPGAALCGSGRNLAS